MEIQDIPNAHDGSGGQRVPEPVNTCAVPFDNRGMRH